MSTRSTIAVELKDGKILSVYCHSDGYISGVGKTLINNYNNYDDAVNLMQYGGISSLGDNMNETSFYSRDWGRKDEKPYRYNNEYCLIYEMSGATMIEYLYLFKNNEWHVSKSKYISKKLLKDAYDVGISYWSKFKPVKSFKKELSIKTTMTEKQMIGQIGKMLSQNFGADNIVIQGQTMPKKSEVN
jgi:hypothetical protein